MSLILQWLYDTYITCSQQLAISKVAMQLGYFEPTAAKIRGLDYKYVQPPDDPMAAPVPQVAPMPKVKRWGAALFLSTVCAIPCLGGVLNTLTFNVPRGTLKGGGLY